MADILFSNQYFCVALTLVAFAIGSALQKKWKLAILNPIILGAFLIMGVLLLLDVPNETYQEGCRILNYLLTPATICLAISFYEQFQVMKKQMGALCLGVIAGSVCCLGTIYILCMFFGFDRVLTMSLLPKSITNAIGVVLSEEIGGMAAITTAGIAITGTFGNIAGPAMCKLFKIHDPIAQGVAFGTASHVIGTSRASEMSELAGAVGSLALTIAGILTAVLLSFVTQFL